MYVVTYNIMCRYKIPVVRNFCVPNPINSTGYTSMQLLLFYWAITWKYVCIHNKPAFYSFEEFILTAKRIHLPTLIMLQILPLLSLSLSPCVNTKINILRLPHIQSCIDWNLTIITTHYSMDQIFSKMGNLL